VHNVGRKIGECVVNYVSRIIGEGVVHNVGHKIV
jgi:hypothetical protein